MNVFVVTEMIGISKEAKNELKKSDTFDFNIFLLRKLTNGKELEATLTYILARRECISKTMVEINFLANFTKAI